MVVLVLSLIRSLVVVAPLYDNLEEWEGGERGGLGLVGFRVSEFCVVFYFILI